MICQNCTNFENLPFTCGRCNKILCRKCISRNKHECKLFSNELEVYNFCSDKDCLTTSNLILCKYCSKKYCNLHIKHNCQKVDCCCSWYRKKN